MTLKKISIINAVSLIGILGSAIGLIYLLFFQPNLFTSKSTDAIETSNHQISVEIRNILTRKMQLLRQDLASNEEFIERVKELSSLNSEYEEIDSARLDAQWQELSASYLTNDISSDLRAFADNNEGFVEIFITDNKGYNLGLTNLTSDFYQADEEWWQIAFNDGDYIGTWEFDESAGSDSISLYIVVEDNTELLGVIKAVVSVDKIVEEL